MINLKNKKEIAIMKEGGRRLRKVVKRLLLIIKEGVTTKEINRKADIFIRESDSQASFKKVKGYFWATCLSINEEIVHTPPSDRILKKGDIITLDIGVYYQGYHTDYATTVVVGETNDKNIKRFLQVGEQTLYKAIEQAKIGNYIGNISQVIEREISKKGLFIIKELTGHGIGKRLHEDPLIPCFFDRPIKKTAKVVNGMALAIEVIYSMGDTTITYKPDSHWSLVTADSSLAACFEHTVIVSENKALILT